MENIHYMLKKNNYHAWLKGRIDITTVSGDKDIITGLLKDRPKVIAFNFVDVDYIDYSGIAAFVTLL
jgi:anti-anti-sigma regulatory factor